MNPRVSIIIVNWNTKECLKDCLKSIYEKVRDISFEIIVVDNASTDGSQEMVKTEFPMISLIANNDNIGFGRACNQAVGKSKGEFLLFLNPDTKLLKADFNEFFKLLEKRDDIGTIVPIIYDDNGNLKYKTLRTVPRIRNMINFYQLKNRLTFNYSIPLSLIDPQEQEYPSGSCFLMRHSTLERLGGFDEHYFLFFEDADLGVRMVQMGLKTISLPEFKIIHIGGKSTEQNIGLRNIFWHQSALYFFKKTAGIKSYLVVKLILIVGVILEMSNLTIKSILRPKPAGNYRELMSNNLNILKWHFSISN